MEEFTIQGGSDFITFILENVYGFPNETCNWGGYDTKSGLKIECGAFSVNSYFYTSTGEFYQFYENLVQANDKIEGNVHFTNYESNFELKLSYKINGQIIISGSFCNINSEYHDTQLEFLFKSDQSYIQETLRQLRNIVNKYGGLKGIKH